MDTEVSRVILPTELDRGKLQLTEIRFDCLVRMFEQATPKKRPPQLFKLETNLTLELVKYGSAQEIGIIIKSAYLNLERAINDYKNSII